MKKLDVAIVLVGIAALVYVVAKKDDSLFSGGVLEGMSESVKRFFQNKWWTDTEPTPQNSPEL